MICRAPHSGSGPATSRGAQPSILKYATTRRDAIPAVTGGSAIWGRGQADIDNWKHLRGDTCV